MAKINKPNPDKRADMIKAICLGLAGGTTALILSIIASQTPIFPYAWAGFISLLIYLATGQQRSWSTVGKMTCSFIAGMVWGQISNLISMHLLAKNIAVAFFLDFWLLIFLLLFVHNYFLKNTPFGFVPAVFLGLILTKGIFGRPIPFIGGGLSGDMPIWGGMLCLIGLFLFGIIFAMMTQNIAAFLMSKLLKKGDK